MRIETEPNKVTRKEVHTRTRFAQDAALKWYGLIAHAVKGGNILTCKATKKFLKARRVYIHYCNEFQNNQNIPLSK